VLDHVQGVIDDAKLEVLFAAVLRVTIEAQLEHAFFAGNVVVQPCPGVAPACEVFVSAKNVAPEMYDLDAERRWKVVIRVDIRLAGVHCRLLPFRVEVQDCHVRPHDIQP
jgi:hypothetical protein